MADDEENSTLTVEMAALMSPGSDTNDHERMLSAYERVRTLLEEYQTPREIFWVVAALIKAKGNWSTFGQRNRALNSAAEALGLLAHPMREDSQGDMHCMTIGFCRMALSMMHSDDVDEDDYLPKDRAEREGFVSNLLWKNLQKVHPKFAKLTVATTKQKLHGRRKNGHVELASDLALEVGLSGWLVSTLREAAKEEGRKLRG